MNSFLGGINLAEAPGFKISIALVIPLLAWLTQWLSTKLMTAVNTNPNVEDNQMANTMKGMNNIMPIMSAIFCITLPAALGIYWIAGAVVRITQQLGINAFMNKMTAEDIIAKNLEKQNKKRAKKGLPPLKSLADDKDSKKSSLTSRFAGQQQDTTNTPKKNMPTKKSSRVDSSEYYKGQNVKQGGIASKARMVTDHDQKSVKKK
jgi:YidC/Oxa1 family membrane protein insertase